jgi:hypothetical protein
MGRTPFGDQAAKSPAISEFGGRPGSSASPARPAAGQPNNVNSLADALKVATGLSDQRRSLQREIAQVLERFAAEGFLERDGETYRYQCKDQDVDRTISELARSYASHLIAVTNMIHSKPRSMRSFSDAFRLRKDT